MIAVTPLILHSLIGAAGQVPAVCFILFQQEERSMNEGRVKFVSHLLRHQDVVKTFPLALIAIGPRHPILSMDATGDVHQMILV